VARAREALERAKAAGSDDAAKAAQERAETRLKVALNDQRHAADARQV
jgi:hypothetical protein